MRQGKLGCLACGPGAKKLGLFIDSGMMLIGDPLDIFFGIFVLELFPLVCRLSQAALGTRLWSKDLFIFSVGETECRVDSESFRTKRPFWSGNIESLRGGCLWFQRLWFVFVLVLLCFALLRVWIHPSFLWPRSRVDNLWTRAT